MTTLLEEFRSNYSATQNEEMSLEDYLELCKRDPASYATAAERMLAGIGEPELVDTRNDPRLGRIFGNRVIRRYPAFREFYGMEDAIEQIVAFFKHAAQGLEERKQILYLLGPVGGGKSSIAERLKARDGEAPHLRDQGLAGQRIAARPVPAGAVRRRCSRRITAFRAATCNGIMSPWAVKRLQEFGGDLSRFRVVRVQPSVLRQVAIAKTEPGDENNQDISSLVGKVDIRKLEHSVAERSRCLQLLGRPVPRQPGAARIRRDVQGADQDAAPAADGDAGGQLQGHRRLLGDPVQRLILAHSNESEWHSFRNNKNNEAFLDRIYIVKVPYCLRVSEEVKIYRKLLRQLVARGRALRARARWR